ncbi:MAG: hypothetical protein ABJB47_00710 [Actinomycetota bacterium]
MIGVSGSDVLAGRAAATRTILLRAGLSGAATKRAPAAWPADAEVGDLPAAVDLLL